MVELSNEKIDKILHEETVKSEDINTILRSIYTRYMRLYEKYFADIDSLNDDVIAELRAYNEETQSLIKYYYMDIPLDVCIGIREFDERYGSILLGPEWHKYLFDGYEEFKRKQKAGDKSEERCKAEFKNEILDAFYDAMDYVFREAFGTGSNAVRKILDGISELLYGKEEKE